MKGKQLRKAVLLGMAMSMAVWTTGMAETPVGPITESYNENNEVTQGDVRVENGTESASIQIGHENTQGDVIVNIKTDANGVENGDILLDSDQYGICTENESTGTIQLDAAGNNTISFADGSGISADSGVAINLEAAGKNTITYTGTGDHDGINAGSGNTGAITLMADSNEISVQGNESDGIYTDAGNTSDEKMIATDGDNVITAGNNGIDHRGSGDVILTAENGGNIIYAGKGQAEGALEGDGIRVAGDGDVTLNAQYNKIIAGDEGIYIGETAGNGGNTVNIYLNATKEKEGYGNYIQANDNGIQNEGNAQITLRAETGHNYVEGSSNGIVVTEGVVRLISSEQNIIKAVQNGITVAGEDSNVILDGRYNTIAVNSSIVSDKVIDIVGLKANDGANISIKNSLQEDISAEQTSISVIENGDQTSYGIRADNSGDIDITSNEVSLSVKKTNELYKNEGTVYGIGVNTMNSLGITPLSSTVDINAVQDIHISVESTGAKASGIDANWGSNVNLHAAQGSVRISALTGAPDSSGGNVFGIKAENDSQINLDVGKDILITTHSNVEEMTNGSLDAGGVWTNNGATATLNAEGILVIDTKDINSSNYGIKALEKNAKVDIMTQGQNEDGIGIYVNSFGKDSYASMAQNGNINVSAQGDIVFNSESRQNSRGVYNGAISTAADTILNANGNNILISAKTNTQTANAYAHGVYNSSMGSFNAKTELTGDIVSINSTSDNTTAYGIYADSVGTGKSDVTIDANEFRIITTSGKTGYGIFSVNANVDIQAINNTYINSSKYGVYAYDVYNNDAIIHINSENDNLIYGENTSVYSRGETADIDLIAGRNNIINAGDIKTVAVDDVDTDFGSAYGIYSVSGSDVTLNAGNQNAVLGAIYAGGKATAVSLIGGSNVIQSAANITNAGDLNDGRHIISSLYAENGAQISVSGAQNVIRTYAENPADPDALERTIWAYNTADITIDGQTYISTDRYEETDEAQKGNSADIAIAAGTATGLDKPTVEAPVLDRATVSVKYDTSSQITGDILSAYQGLVDITPKNDTAQVHITGNILAGNNGVLNVNLGNGGTLTGRADDYGDAGVVDNSGHGTEFFDPAFSSDIFKGGEVNLTMGNNSRWNVTGQSWITRINTEDSSNVIIDLVSANTDKNSSAHALTVYEMNGDAVFNMSLDADRTVSDMVYMKNATGEYVVNVVDPVTQADMYAGKSDGGIFDGLRFATVGKGSKATFRAITWDQGINNIEYEVGTDKYAGNDENAHYDSTAGGTGNTEKPGTDLVEGFFDNDGTPGVQANGIMTMAARANENMGTDTGDNGTEVDETTNFKLIGVKSSEISDAGKTVVAMSRVNYANAVYMDRLNKRMGEARYIDGDEGLWVRMRHDRIGKSDAFRSMNTMMELGYDTRVNDREDGEHRQGVAIDYMRGTADYKNVAGEGDVRRGGIWFYDTWLGNKGHYTDYVLKFGRLSNDFELYTRTLGEKVIGDYSNFVYSASAEYGRKKDLGNNWYIEPQAQIQYAHVTDADYTTSQDTHVQLDAIDSLIGRVGFRLGKDVGEKSTFYITM